MNTISNQEASVTTLVFQSLKEVFLAFTPSRSMYEAMMKYDFKFDLPRSSLMQLCFSNLASWPLFILLALIYIDPFKLSWTLQGFIQKVSGVDSSVGFTLLDGRPVNMLCFFLVFFLLEWIVRKEYLFIAVIFYFLAKADIHIHLALASVLAIYFSRCCYMWWLHIDLKSQTRKIWIVLTLIQLISITVVCLTAIYSLSYLQNDGFFSATVLDNRFEFLFYVVLAFHLIAHICSSVWGHFTLNKKTDPSFLPIYYSTTVWILKVKISNLVKKHLKEKTEEILVKHQESLRQLNEVTDQGLALQLDYLYKVLSAEIAFLKLALVRLNVD